MPCEETVYIGFARGIKLPPSPTQVSYSSTSDMKLKLCTDIIPSISNFWKSSILYSYLVHFAAQAPQNKKKSTPQKIPYISGNGTF